MLFTAHQYTVTDTDITATGKKEIYEQETREDAIAACLYTHKLHNRNAIASISGVIHCQTCGQMAVVYTPTIEQAQTDRRPMELTAHYLNFLTITPNRPHTRQKREG